MIKIHHLVIEVTVAHSEIIFKHHCVVRKMHATLSRHSTSVMYIGLCKGLFFIIF